MPMEFDEQEVFFFKQKTAYEIPKRDWSSDVCSSDLSAALVPGCGADGACVPSVTGGAEADGAGAVPEPLSSFFPDGKNSAASGRI